jgi:hypothetical protein
LVLKTNQLGRDRSNPLSQLDAGRTKFRAGVPPCKNRPDYSVDRWAHAAAQPCGRNSPPCDPYGVGCVRRVQQKAISFKLIKMNLHHTAALALLGWYLMVPPNSGGSRKPLDLNAPLSTWEKSESYDSKAECEDARSTRISERQDKSDEIKSRKTRQILQRAIEQLQHGQCISADDPRLEGPGETSQQQSKMP